MATIDAGINSSAAWTTSLEDEVVRRARALYDFDGQEQLHELAGVVAGDDLEIIKEDLPDGWSLVRTNGQLGLLPRSYYTFIADFVCKPDTGVTPQTTGEWRGPLQSLLGGISLNRFSSFVTSGAESWVLNGVSPQPPSQQHSENDAEDNEDSQPSEESERHYIDTGPSWKAKIPPFKILVHSPSKRTSVLSGPYTIYSITSLFSPDDPYDPPYTSHHNRLHSDFIPRSMRRFSSHSNHDNDNNDDAEPTPLHRLTVYRRFSHFITLHTTLLRRLPGLALPPLPAKQYTGRFNSSFIEARRSDLERFLNSLIRHPIARYAEILTFFLSCDSDSDFTKLLPKYTSLPPAGPQFYARVYHPAFNLDVEDAMEAGVGFATHVRAVKRSVQGLRALFSRVREARVEMARMERGLGYAILGMITSGISDPNTVEEEDEEDDSGGHKTNKKPDCSKGIVNSSGAWCWREDCKECLHLTRGLQKFSDTLQSVADLYDDHARRTQLAAHESLKSMAHPDAIYAPILDTHNATLSRYRSALADSSNDPNKAELASRCETVLNTTMSEMDIYHTQKVEDFHRFGVEHLDGEIRLYEQILTRLQSARSTLTSPLPSSSSSASHPLHPRPHTITPSIYTRDLFPNSSPPPNSITSPAASSSSTSRFFYPYNNSKLITTAHKFIPSSGSTIPTSSAGSGSSTTLGIGEVQIPALPMPAPHVFDGVGWTHSSLV